MKSQLSLQFWLWIIGGLIILLFAVAFVACSVCSTSLASSHALPFFCDAKITDLAVAYFTYCLVIVGWFGIRGSQKAAEIVERAYLSPGYGLMIEDRSEVRVGIHLGVRNTGRTVGILKIVHHALSLKSSMLIQTPSSHTMSMLAVRT